MAEYIDRKDAIEAVKHAWAKGLDPTQYIEIIPAADAAPVRHGKWINSEFTDNSGDSLFKFALSKCSECGKQLYGIFSNYCPNCGAKMDGGTE